MSLGFSLTKKGNRKLDFGPKWLARVFVEVRNHKVPQRSRGCNIYLPTCVNFEQTTLACILDLKPPRKWAFSARREPNSVLDGRFGYVGHYLSPRACFRLQLSAQFDDARMAKAAFEKQAGK